MLNGHSPNCLTRRVCTFVWCQYLAGMSLNLRSVVFAPSIVQGLGKSGTTFFACFQYISERKPAMIIAENLPQLLHTKFAKDKESLLNWFEKDPLLVVEWIVLHRLPASRRLGRFFDIGPRFGVFDWFSIGSLWLLRSIVQSAWLPPIQTSSLTGELRCSL